MTTTLDETRTKPALVGEWDEPDPTRASTDMADGLRRSVWLGMAAFCVGVWSLIAWFALG
jgi:hypothetical protein